MKISDVMKASFIGPTRLLLHSVEGFGKTTLAAFFPRPVFVSAERSFPRDLGFNPMHVEPTTWNDVITFVRSLIEDQHDFETIVFDTWDWIDALVQRYVCDRDTNRKSEINPKGHVLEGIEDYGYGKGYVQVAEQVRTFTQLLNELQSRRGMHIVVLSHSHVKEFKNPAGENFDRWVPKVHERSARIWVEWAENVLFGYFEVTASKDDPKKLGAKAKASGTDRRILGAKHHALYDAKNRFNLAALIELGAPADLIPYLIGAHLNPPPDYASKPPEQPKTGNAPPRESAPDELAQRRNSARTVEREPEREVSTREEQQGPQHSPTRDASSGKRMESNEERRERTLTEPAKRETERERQIRAAAEQKEIERRYNESQQAKTDPTQGTTASPPAVDVNPAIEQMRADVKEHLGSSQLAKVDKWLKQAGGDPQRIDSVFTEVSKMIADAQNEAARD